VIEARPGGSRAPLAAAAGLLVAAGAGALVIELLWVRELRLALGIAPSALAAAAAALAAGHAAGARLGEHVALYARNPLLAWGALALAGALGALAMPHALAALAAGIDAHYEALLSAPPLLAAARGGVALAATLPGALAIGAFLPALLAATLGGRRALGGAGIGLYALYALGSAAGAGLATFWLVERAGLEAALAWGAALLGGAGVVAVAVARRWGHVAPAALARAGESAAPAFVLPRWLLALAALSGFGAYAAQLLFARALGRVSNQSVFAEGALLVIGLACIGLGALFTYSLSQRAHPQRTLGVSLAVAGAALLVFPSGFVAATDGLAILVVDAPWPAYLTEFVALASAAMAPALLPAACVFPATLAGASRIQGRDGRALGAATARLLAWQALGVGSAAVLAPAVLLPALGLWGAIASVAALYLLGSLRPLAAGFGPRFAVYVAILAGLILVVARPSLRAPPDAPVVARGASSSSPATGPAERGFPELGAARERARQERRGHLPLLLHPHPRRALFLGDGGLASAALAHRLDAIWLVELAPDLGRAARMRLSPEARGLHGDARARLAPDDASPFLRGSRTRFDVIVADAIEPWRAGRRYTVEHFANARARLEPGGVFCQWLRLDQLTREEFLLIARSFARAFPAGELWRGDFYGARPSVGLCGAVDGGSSDALGAVRTLPDAADRWIAHAAGVQALYVGRLGPHWLGEGAVETEASPVLEFVAARSHAGRLREPFTGVAWAEFALRIATREQARVGLLLQAASALHAAGRVDEAAALFEEAARLLPPELVRDAPADPSATELGVARRD
jgi:spermidine synthase